MTIFFTYTKTLFTDYQAYNNKTLHIKYNIIPISLLLNSPIKREIIKKLELLFIIILV